MLSNESPLLMDHMFEEDPIVERLRYEGLNNIHDNMDRQSDGMTMPDGLRDVTRLVAFLSMEVKMHAASLLRGD